MHRLLYPPPHHRKLGARSIARKLPNIDAGGASFRRGKRFAAMPRFFFHVYDDVVALDEEGCELPDLEAVRQRAIEGARELACEQIRKGKLTLHHRIEVEDEDGKTAMIVPFRLAFRIED